MADRDYIAGYEAGRATAKRDGDLLERTDVIDAVIALAAGDPEPARLLILGPGSPAAPGHSGWLLQFDRHIADRARQEGRSS